MALQQVPEPGQRRGRAADTAPERLQDLQPDGARADRARGAGQYLRGCGWTPHFVEGDDPETMHQLMAAALDEAIAEIHEFHDNARDRGDTARPRWPMIVLRSPKGWTGPKVVDGLQIEGTFRSHQVPLLVDPQHPDHVGLLESWMKSYRPEELFDDAGRLMAELAELAPKGDRAHGCQSPCERGHPAA